MAMRAARPSWFLALAAFVLLAVILPAQRADADVDSKDHAEKHADNALTGDDVRVQGGGSRNPMYFYLNLKSTGRCFVVKQSPGTWFHVHYDYPDAEEGVEVKMTFDELVEKAVMRSKWNSNTSKTLRGADDKSGSHEFKVGASGAYTLCVSATRKALKPFEERHGLRLSLEFDVGLEDKSLEALKKRYKLENLEFDLVKVRLDAKGMLPQADFMKREEDEYHKMVGRLNREALLWRVAQIVILIITGVYQVRHLQAFFKAKRLV